MEIGYNYFISNMLLNYNHAEFFFIIAALVFYSITKLTWKFNNGKLVYFLLVLFLITQGLLAYFGFYKVDYDAFPPRILIFGIFPGFVLSYFVFKSVTVKTDLNQFRLIRGLILIHLVRLPIELVLHDLYKMRLLPQEMTFTGLNWDIVVGLSSPVMAILSFRLLKNSQRSVLIAWNILGLLFLVNVMVIGILTSRAPIQQFSFHQPNIAILMFPYVWLPTFLVPVMFWSHVYGIKLLKKSRIILD